MKRRRSARSDFDGWHGLNPRLPAGCCGFFRFALRARDRGDRLVMRMEAKNAAFILQDIRAGRHWKGGAS